MDLLNIRNKEQKFLNTCFALHQAFNVDNSNPLKKDRVKFIIFIPIFMKNHFFISVADLLLFRYPVVEPMSKHIDIQAYKNVPD